MRGSLQKILQNIKCLRFGDFGFFWGKGPVRKQCNKVKGTDNGKQFLWHYSSIFMYAYSYTWHVHVFHNMDRIIIKSSVIFPTSFCWSIFLNTFRVCGIQPPPPPSVLKYNDQLLKATIQASSKSSLNSNSIQDWPNLFDCEKLLRGGGVFGKALIKAYTRMKYALMYWNNTHRQRTTCTIHAHPSHSPSGIRILFQTWYLSSSTTIKCAIQIDKQCYKFIDSWHLQAHYVLIPWSARQLNYLKSSDQNWRLYFVRMSFKV